jgi:hypothetical protein
VEQAAVLLPEAMAIDTMRTSDKNKLCKLRPVDLASRAFYKNFWNFNRDLGYTYGAEKAVCSTYPYSSGLC